MAVHDTIYDKRTIKRQIKKGSVDKKSYDEYLKSLKDCQSLCEEVIVPLEEDEVTESTPKLS